MLNVLKVRIYPNKKQELALAKNFGCVRFVWNYYLNKTNNQYLETGKGMTYCDMAKDLTQLKKQLDFEWLAEATAATLQQSLKNLESAFKNFFSKRTKFPKFKSKNKKQSIRYPESCSIRNKGIKLPKLGVVKAKISQVINGKIKSVTVSKTSTDKYFAAILFEMDDSTTIEKLKISGIDLGLSSLVTVFDGETTYKIDPIKPTRKYAKRLKRRQQALSRKAKGSNNRQKAIKEVAKVHEKIANKREGGKLVEVDRFYPSTKLCSCCGFKNDLLTLSIREWICPECKTQHDRDENAAKNVREEGMRILSTNTDGQSEFQAWGETVRLVGTCTEKRVSVNQESPVTASA